MSGIGQRLIDAREARGLTAADVAKKLCIRTMFVDALEREDWQAIGDPIYARGFLKNYARFVGLDADGLAAEANEEIGGSDARPVISAFVQIDRGVIDSRENRVNVMAWAVPITAVVAALLVALVVVNGVGLLRGGGNVTAVAPESTDSPSPQPSASSADLSAAGSQTSAGLAAGVDLRIAVTQPCWLSVTVDGKRVLYSTLPTGSVREFRADREITLRAGNAGGIVATIDGKDIGSLGRVGQVEDRVFAIATPAPAPSSGAQ
jgi:cytoskeletal protein RodZ